MHESSVGR